MNVSYCYKKKEKIVCKNLENSYGHNPYGQVMMHL